MSSNWLFTARGGLLAHAASVSAANATATTRMLVMAEIVASARHSDQGKKVKRASAEANEPGEIGLDRPGNLAELLGPEVFVKQEAGDRPAPLRPAADVHRRDIDVETTEDRADPADHAGAILVGNDQDVALGREFDVQVSQLDDARLAVEDGARDRLLAFG